MSWVFVWLLLALVVTVVVLVFAVSLGRHAVIVGRTARRFQDEIAPAASEVSREAAAASERAQRLEVPRGTAPR
jgi:Sec-independent protein translocase protein TatA